RAAERPTARAIGPLWLALRVPGGRSLRRPAAARTARVAPGARTCTARLAPRLRPLFRAGIPRRERREGLGNDRAPVHARRGQVTEQRMAGSMGDAAVDSARGAARPNVVDLCFQAAYRVAYRLMRA